MAGAWERATGRESLKHPIKSFLAPPLGVVCKDDVTRVRDNGFYVITCFCVLLVWAHNGLELILIAKQSD